MHLVNLPVSIALLLFSVLDPEIPPTRDSQLPGGVALTGSAEITAGFDDNALLGRRGQFLDSTLISGDRRGRVNDLVTRQKVELEFSRTLSNTQQLGLFTHTELALLRQQDDLRGYDVVAAANHAYGRETAGEINTALALLYHRETPEWSYRSLQPRLRVKKLFDFGLGSEFNYQLSKQDFARDAQGLAQLKNSYANIDVITHEATLALRLWHGRRVRSGLTGNFQVANYRGNLSANLANYATLPASQNRQDLGGGVTAALLLVVFPHLVVTPMTKFEHNTSNSKPYILGAVHAGIAGLWEPFTHHSFYAQFDFGRFDFPEERFDRRFTNTRLDFRRELRLAYRYRLAAGLLMGLSYHRRDSVSNDCAQFDPQRDEFGLPVNSRSYSCFSQNMLELAFTYEIGGHDS